MPRQIRLRLDARDITDLVRGRVLYKEETGSPRGTGTGFTAGENPVEICLTEGDQEPLRNLLFNVKTSGGHKVGGSWPPCPKCKATAGYSSNIIPGPPPAVEISCNACMKVVATLPLNIP
jgi:hypothetical protein